MTSPRLCPPGVKLGLWLDDAPRLVRTDGFLRALEDLGFDELGVMIDRHDRAWRSIWSERELEELADLVEPMGYRLVLTTWPWPDRDELEAMLRDMPELLEAARAVAWEVDAEGNWLAKRRRGFRSLAAAADFFAPRWLDVCRAADARAEFTTYPGHLENGSRAVLADDADLLLPQGYSVRYRKSGNKTVEIPLEHRLGPGKMQRWTLDKARSVPGSQVLGCGLAAYEQTGWPITPEEAMRIAYEAALARNARVLRWWSSKWIIGKFARRNAYAARFLNTIR